MSGWSRSGKHEEKNLSFEADSEVTDDRINGLRTLKQEERLKML